MKKITPSLEINFEQFGKAASLPGLLLARDVIDEQIRILRGDIQEPEEALETLAPARPYQKRPPGQFIPGVRVSMRGLHRGTDAFRAADAHNKQVIRDARREMEPTNEDEQTISLTGLSGRARRKAISHNSMVYYRRTHPKLSPEERHKAQAQGGRNSWSGVSQARRKQRVAAMLASRLRAKAAAENSALVNGAA